MSRTLMGQPGAPRHERLFYARHRAIGRYGVRVFTPQAMDRPHWHGHIEANFLIGGRLYYDFAGSEVEIPEKSLALFWAGLPHQVTEVRRTANNEPLLTNIYIPLDAFLMMPNISELGIALLSGGVFAVPAEFCGAEMVAAWHRDYRSNDFERAEISRSEINTVLRRALHLGLEPLLARDKVTALEPKLNPWHLRHVVTMIGHITENLGKRLSNSDIAAATGLHENYALNLFSGTMGLPIQRFVLRMRLLQARAHLIEGNDSTSRIAAVSGFRSTSQFYHQFRTAFGMPPNELRRRFSRSPL